MEILFPDEAINILMKKSYRLQSIAEGIDNYKITDFIFSKSNVEIVNDRRINLIHPSVNIKNRTSSIFPARTNGLDNSGKWGSVVFKPNKNIKLNIIRKHGNEEEILSQVIVKKGEYKTITFKDYSNGDFYDGRYFLDIKATISPTDSEVETFLDSEFPDVASKIANKLTGFTKGARYTIPQFKDIIVELSNVYEDSVPQDEDIYTGGKTQSEKEKEEVEFNRMKIEEEKNTSPVQFNRFIEDKKEDVRVEFQQLTPLQKLVIERTKDEQKKDDKTNELIIGAVLICGLVISVYTLHKISDNN